MDGLSPNRPGPGEITLDHTGHFVADPGAAEQRLRSLGFTVTPRSVQVRPDPKTGISGPTGTGNICVMLEEGYLEILFHTADTDIGREFSAALSRRAGLHLVAFGVADAETRHAELEASGLPMRPLVRFSRKVGTLDARFTVARVAAGEMPEGRVQTLTHHDVAAMWQPQWTRHDNGAMALRSLILSSPDPVGTARRFEAIIGRSASPRGDGLQLSLDVGTLEILPEAQATALLGEAVAPGVSCLAGLRIAVADPGRFIGLPGARKVGTAVALPFGAALGPGAFLFEPARS
ncbi:hypothetical protein GCM10011415_38780 [Salipiger pallidus]|uniref:Glyoxalase-like domain-containing protein n=1 Tax=Salipiger pallidus TaxID=1775170 RepID=A0A8J2ZNK4_9RHOB|nr:VOC family protein [Salipiger pallidus]GGG84877.1 hypothetical protein GCM10011415_38780 [Salipiger pallidus]